MRDVLWYTVNKTDLVRLVVVHDPDGVQPDDFFLTTDLTASLRRATPRYAANCGPSELPQCQPPQPTATKSPVRYWTPSPTPPDRSATLRKSIHP